MNDDDYFNELNFCLKLRGDSGGCTFGGGNKCEECAVPYILRKFISGEVLHGDIQRLTLQDWKNKIQNFKL